MPVRNPANRGFRLAVVCPDDGGNGGNEGDD
jgi:hypothetical protein